MKGIPLLLSAFLLLLISNLEAAPRKVFIMAGQSNADGRTDITTMPQYIQDYVKTPSRYCYWSYCNGTTESWNRFGGKFLPYQPYTDNNAMTRCGFDGIVYHLIEEALQTRFYVIKESRGGTAIDPRCTSTGNLWWCCDPAWLATASPRSGHSLALELTQNIGLLIDNVLSSLRDGYEVQCIMWHQGESDRTRPFDYADNLRRVVSYLRNFLVNKTGQARYATLPFITGTPNRGSTQANAVVEASYWQLAQEDENFHVVDMSDCKLGSDVLHFDAQGNQTAALRMFNKLVSLGLVEADTIAVSQAPADTLRLTKTLIRNYDFEYYEGEDGIVLNDGKARQDGRAPYGWQHSWTGYPEAEFPSATATPSFGITGSGSSGQNGKSHCWYKARYAMPDGFELWQEIPAGVLSAGTYRVSCRIGLSYAKPGLTRIFAGSHVLYPERQTRYDTEAIALVHPDEEAVFGSMYSTDVGALADVGLLVSVGDGESLRFGIRSEGLSHKGVAATTPATGAFTTDFWRIVKVSDEPLPSQLNKYVKYNNVENEGHHLTDHNIYDLGGRHLPMPPKDGIYIQNKKKLLVRQ